MYFQQNTWMDEDINIQWVQGNLFQELGMTKKKKFYLQTMLAWNKVKHSMKHKEIISTLQFT